jgi:predicted ArsR family transcriptional regulator
MKDIIWYLLAGTRGGHMRSRILYALQGHPRNAHQLAQKLGVDYTTIQHHLKLLLEHQLVEALPQKTRYGQPYRRTAYLVSMWDEYRSIWDELGKT